MPRLAAITVLAAILLSQIIPESTTPATSVTRRAAAERSWTPPNRTLPSLAPAPISTVDGFEFANDPPSAYTRVDRLGMPAINTAVVTSRDDYNAADPIDDVGGAFAGELIANIAGLHDALDDDLTGLNLTPCEVIGDGTGSCLVVAAPLVLPDTIKMDLTGTAGFPNGRLLTDPVIDVTLAVVLLDLANGAHTAVDLVGINPTANDVPFDMAFPYLAAPHP